MANIRKPKPGQSLAEARPDLAEEFAVDLNGITPNEIGKGSAARVWWRCNKCGTEWELPVVKRVSMGTGCPQCAKTRNRKTHERFVAEVAEINPTIEVIGKYVNQRTKVLLRCRECGHEWEAIPNNTLRGCGCPKCAEKRFDRPRANKPRKDKVVDVINHRLYVKNIDEGALAHMLHKAYVLPDSYIGMVMRSFYTYAFNGYIEAPGEDKTFPLDMRLPREAVDVFKSFLVENGEDPSRVDEVLDAAWQEMELHRKQQIESTAAII